MKHSTLNMRTTSFGAPALGDGLYAPDLGLVDAGMLFVAEKAPVVDVHVESGHVQAVDAVVRLVDGVHDGVAVLLLQPRVRQRQVHQRRVRLKVLAETT